MWKDKHLIVLVFFLVEISIYSHMLLDWLLMCLTVSHCDYFLISLLWKGWQWFMGWVPSLKKHTKALLWLFFNFPNYLFPLIKCLMEITTLTNDWLGPRLKTLYNNLTKSQWRKWMGNLLPETQLLKRGVATVYAVYLCIGCVKVRDRCQDEVSP